MKLISACLLGIGCSWSGDNKYMNNRAIELSRVETLIPICPEKLGGLATPRAPQEIQWGTGEDVLSGKCRVIDINGEDVTREFIQGAEETLKIARLLSISEFIAKSTSPSCGCGQIYDGSFSGQLVAGDGVTTALLKVNGVRVIREENL